MPSWRMAYDRDGTQAYTWDNKTQMLTALSHAQMVALNDEGPTLGPQIGDGTEVHGSFVVFIFPEVRDLDAYFVSAPTGGVEIQNVEVQVSANTTNGMDGAWTTVHSGFDPRTGTDKDGMRTRIRGSTALGIKGVRFVTRSTYRGNYISIHLYGEPLPGENPDRLVLWHPTEDRRISPAHLDFGNVPRGSSADKSFRVKNLSGVYSAQSVRVAMEALTDGSPSVPSLHSLSYAGGPFLAQVNVGSVGPGGVSTPVTIRQVLPTNAQLGLFWFRVFAEAGSWA